MDLLATSIKKLFQDGISAISEALETTQVAEFPTHTHLYYAISRSLHRGYDPDASASDKRHYPRRPPLPIELVIMIISVAGFSKHKPALEIRTTNRIKVSSGGPLATAMLMHTKPMTTQFLSRLRRVQLQTFSMDQGWVGDRSAGSWSWFELVILQPLRKPGSSSANDSPLDVDAFDPDIRQLYIPPPESTVDRTPVRTDYKIKRVSPDHLYDGIGEEGWVSHHNDLAGATPRMYIGKTFDSNADIWRHLEVGDILGVFAYARFAGWQNSVLNGTLVIWERFDPTGLSL